MGGRVKKVPFSEEELNILDQAEKLSADPERKGRSVEAPGRRFQDQKTERLPTGAEVERRIKAAEVYKLRVGGMAWGKIAKHLNASVDLAHTLYKEQVGELVERSGGELEALRDYMTQRYEALHAAHWPYAVNPDSQKSISHANLCLAVNDRIVELQGLKIKRPDVRHVKVTIEQSLSETRAEIRRLKKEMKEVDGKVTKK